MSLEKIMNIDYGFLGILQRGWFEDRLFLLKPNEHCFSDNMDKRLGFRTHGIVIGWLLSLSCFGSKTTRVLVGDKSIYINNQSYFTYICRKTATPINKDSIEKVRNLFNEIVKTDMSIGELESRLEWQFRIIC